VEVVKMLLDAKADVLMQTNVGGTALHHASVNGHAEVVKMLLDAKADVSMQDKEGWTALHVAAGNGHVEVVKMLLDAKADVSMQNQEGWTALHAAAHNGHVEVVKILLDAKEDVSALKKHGWTSLHAAAFSARMDTVMKLLQFQSQHSHVLVDDSSEVNNEDLPPSPNTETSTVSHPNLGSKVEILAHLSFLLTHDYTFPRMLGDALWKEKLYSQAIASYETSLQRDPSNTMSRIEKLSHGPVICDDCRKPLIGIRYRCMECNDYDLCVDCYSKPTRMTHNTSETTHEFLPIPSDAWISKQPLSDTD
jgi:Ankyrin repeats (3 copies)/Zinc finger, ZZ type/Ankyrin repeat